MSVALDLMGEEKLSTWLRTTTPGFLVIAVVLALALHSFLALAFTQLLIPISALVGIQLITAPLMYRAKRRAKLKGDYNFAVFVFGGYCLAVLLLAIHYGTKWGLISKQNAETHYLGVTVSALIGCVGALAIFRAVGKRIRS